jgi:SAM-dependent methyltransferase
MSDAQIPAMLRLNKATNRLYYRLTRRPHHFELYKQLTSEAVARGKTAVHLGAGKVWLGEICAAPLDGVTVFAVEPDAETLALNPTPNKICAPGEAIPLPDESVDAIVCEYVVEHLLQPEEVLRELHRILRPGGRFVFVTPNAWSYSAIATRITSQRFHEIFLGRLLKLGASANEKPFPTAFRMNTRSDIERLARAEGFSVHALYSCVDHPTYTYPFPVIHQAAALWHLLLDKLEVLEPLRIGWIGVFEKQVR